MSPRAYVSLRVFIKQKFRKKKIFSFSHVLVQKE